MEIETERDPQLTLSETESSITNEYLLAFSQSQS
jgi:hypothetical protein